MGTDFFISSDKSKIDINVVYNYLNSESYWAKHVPMDIVARSIENSFCFGVYKRENNYNFTQIGFARVITDKATFGYLADVFILEEYRGIGLSKSLMEEIINHPELQGFRSWMLATKDAHSLYERFGFKLTNDTTRIIRKQGIENY